MRSESSIDIYIRRVEESDIEQYDRKKEYESRNGNVNTKISKRPVLGEIQLDIHGFSTLDMKVKKQIMEELKKQL